MEYKTVGQLKVPQGLDPEKQKLVDEIASNYMNELSDINADNLKNKGRIIGGALLSGASFHPFFNIPYVGTGLGGAMYDVGQGIVEGQKLPELAKRAGRGFVIGETVGAVPYVGKLASKTKAGQAAGKALDEAAEKFAQTKAYDTLMTEINPLKEVENSGLFDSSINNLYDKSIKSDISLSKQLSGKTNVGSYADSIKNAYDDLIAKRKIQADVNPLSKTGSGMMYDSTPEEWIKTAESLKKGERNPLKYKGESVIINNISPKQKEYIFNEVNSTISDLEKENGSLRRLLHNYDDDSDYLYHIFYDPDGKHNIARSIKIDDDFYDRPK